MEFLPVMYNIVQKVIWEKKGVDFEKKKCTFTKS